MTSHSFPPFSLSRLLATVFAPQAGERVAILIDLPDPRLMKDFAFLQDPQLSIQRHAYDAFYQGLKKGVLQELQLQGGECYAYAPTGGSNLDLPDLAVDAHGQELSLSRNVYPNYDIILCISTYSATAPLTALAKQFGFRGATLHGLNDIILNSGLSVDYNVVSRDAEKLRQSMTRADYFEIDFALQGKTHTLRIDCAQQEAQKSHGLCRGKSPDIANLPAGEVYFVPTGAEGTFPLRYEDDGTLALAHVMHGHITHMDYVSGDRHVVDAHNQKLQQDPATGALGELGFGTQVLPVSGRDIQDEKILGTLHVATGRNDHLGGALLPQDFKQRLNATHEDILFSPTKTPEIQVVAARMIKDGQTRVVIQNYQFLAPS